MSATEQGLNLKAGPPAAPAIPLATAQRYARNLFEWLSPHCERLMVAGSIRRERPFVNDVDLVCIPKVIEEKDLMGAIIKRENLALTFLQGYVAEKQKGFNSGVRFICGGEPRPDGQLGRQVMLQLPKCQLDLFFADEYTFATRLLCRTGSKEHNIWLCQRAIERGGKWHPYEGLLLDDKMVSCRTEEDIYGALGLKWIKPEDREIGWLRQNIDSGLTI